MVFRLQCYMRGYIIGSIYMGAIQWSLNGTRGSWGGLQCHFRGYTGSRSAIQLSLGGTGNRGSRGGIQWSMTL